MTVASKSKNGHFLFFVFIFYFLYSFSFSPRGRFVFQTEISGKYIVLVLISQLFYFLSSLRCGDQSTVFCIVSFDFNWSRSPKIRHPSALVCRCGLADIRRIFVKCLALRSGGFGFPLKRGFFLTGFKHIIIQAVRSGFKFRPSVFFSSFSYKLPSRSRKRMHH